MTHASTLCELLEQRSTLDRSITYLEGDGRTRVVSYGDLRHRALGILNQLQALGARPGDHLILHLNHNEQFIDAFWGALLGGIIPVPVAVGISDEHRHKLLRIARQLGAPYLYTDRRTLQRLASFAAASGESQAHASLVQRVFLADDVTAIATPGRVHQAEPEDIAFIQFSSGSTSEPKGVVLSHANILANGRGAGAVARFSSEDISLSWMPLTHDMGLIGMHVYMLMHGVQIHLMPTELFVRRPLLWLEQATRIRATILASPNFGYRHYLKVLGDRSYQDLDLAAVRLIFNGAEPISAELCREFLSRMAHAGLRSSAMYPVYGLAEASLAVSFPPLDRELRVGSFDRHRLGVGEVPRVLPATARDAIEFASVGAAIPGCELQLLDAAGQPTPAGRVGHIQIRGANVTRGYYGTDAANDGVPLRGWLDTGDLGVMLDGELYITGRSKEIIFVNGQNYYPHDLEGIAQRAATLELGKVAAAGVRPRGAEADQLVLFVLHRGDLPEFLPIALEVARLVNEHTGLEVTEVVPVRRIPKTTSGKLQRHLLEQAYVNGEFDAERAALAALQAESVPFEAPGGTALVAQLKSICDAELGKPIDVGDNLFEIGASSLKLIAIHEAIDRRYPGMVDLTELFDFPTLTELAGHLEGKLAAAAAQSA